MNCDCITTLNAQLKERNLKLDLVGFKMPGFVATFYFPLEWIDKTQAGKGRKHSPPNMFVSFCPFCGVKCDTEAKEDPEEIAGEVGAMMSRGETVGMPTGS